MELKHADTVYCPPTTLKLLIGPDGIETRGGLKQSINAPGLLIGPDGIETAVELLDTVLRNFF